MGFFDEFEEGSGAWIKADEKNELMDNGAVLTIKSVSREDTERFGERYRLEVIVDGAPADVRLLGFGAGSVESRDRMLDAMAKYLEDPAAELPIVVLEKDGRSQLLRAAEAPKKTAAKK